jgi:hypothetical protein
MIIVLIVTLDVEIPINRQIETVDRRTLPSERGELRDRGGLYRAMRTFVSIGALGLTTASSLIDRP